MSPPPVCLILCTEFPPGPGGIGTHAFYLARELAARGWRVRVVTPQDYAGVEERRAFNAAQPFLITTLAGGTTCIGRLWGRGLALAAAARRTRPDVVVASGSRALWVGAVVAWVLRRPLVVVGHGSEFVAPRASRRVLVAVGARSARLVVAVSEYTAQLARKAGVAPGSIAVVHNGADGTRFHPSLDVDGLRRELGLEGRRVLLTVGQMSERKAQDVVIRSMVAVLRRHPEAAYVVAGLPTRRRELEGLAAECGVGHAVRFVGAIADDDLPVLYNLCDVFVLVSRRLSGGDVEGFGIVVREAGLCGKPSVVSDGSGLAEAVNDGETGLVVPPESVEATAEAIVRLLGDDQLRESMGTAARALALGSTWDRQIERYDRLLRRVVSAK
ncbi:MAG: glycosyltransferase family 4 protein [Thermoleophilia bacterium]|nr:glycosyltransferase family 4 protein [Thermoleophilia bacterium]